MPKNTIYDAVNKKLIKPCKIGSLKNETTGLCEKIKPIIQIDLTLPNLLLNNNQSI